MTVTKLDLKAMNLAPLYKPSAKEFALVEVPPLNFLMIDGQGDPNTAQAYKDALEALYSVSYTLKFASKKGPGIDYTVMPLEGLWWADDIAVFTGEGQRDRWQWTAMIVQPEHISREMVERGIAEAGNKKALPALPKMRFETLHEGLCVQIMHLGPFSAEGPTLRRLHEEFIPQNGLVENGKHHEIYLSDFRRTAPEKLKTVLRQPVKRR